MALTFCEVCNRTTPHFLNNCSSHSIYEVKVASTPASAETLGLLAHAKEKRRKKEAIRKRRLAIKVEAARLQKWKETGKDRKPKLIVKVEPHLKFEDPSSLSACLACGASIGEVNSYPADVAISFFRKEEEGDPLLVMQGGEVTSIPTIKNISYPVTKRGRVCGTCTLLKGVTLLPEWSDRSKESSNVLSEARPQNYRLTTTRFDRAKGFGKVFNNTKE